MIHAGYLPEVFGDLLGGTFEANDIPQIEPCLACSLGAAVVGEQPLHSGHVVPFAQFIERDVARQDPAAAGADYVQRFGRFPVEPSCGSLLRPYRYPVPEYFLCRDLSDNRRAVPDKNEK